MELLQRMFKKIDDYFSRVSSGQSYRSTPVSKSYPTPECPDFSALENLSGLHEYLNGTKRLSDEAQAHVDTCKGCRELLTHMRPPGVLIEQLMEQVREYRGKPFKPDHVKIFNSPVNLERIVKSRL